jgi:hypothetical protein
MKRMDYTGPKRPCRLLADKRFTRTNITKFLRELRLLPSELFEPVLQRTAELILVTPVEHTMPKACELGTVID